MEERGDFIGPYRLMEEIGEGGFGVVWLAERREPHMQRVALKIIKPGMDTRAVIARFEQERQALALMDHPNIAKVFDAGATAGGRPYFVMEYVRGESITEYCDRNRLTTRQRLELFVQVCEAVQHAHMKGIIHRDLKPSNILVSVPDGGGGASPKVIDFGVAKAISHTLTEKTIFTERGQLIGTPEYMSPEQAEMGGTDVDTRTDVYALGVVLYELIAGVLPFDSRTLRAVGLEEIRRIIREVDAPKPSTRLSGLAGPSATAIAERRQSAREGLARELRRELEWIPLKALRKDRTLRYETAKDLAEDVRNYLEGRALRAGPESATYQARKFVRRHRVGVTAGGLVAAALVAGIGGTSWGMYRANVAEQGAVKEKNAAIAAKDGERREKEKVTAAGVRAEREKVKAERVSKFLRDMLGAANPESNTRQEMTVREMLDRAAAAIGTELADEPEVRLAVMVVIGRSYAALGIPGRALEHLRAARALARELGARSELAEATLCVGSTLRVFARNETERDEGEEALRESYRLSREEFGEHSPEAAWALAELSGLQGEWEGSSTRERVFLAAMAFVAGGGKTVEDCRREIMATAERCEELCAAGREGEARALIKEFARPFLARPEVRVAVPSRLVDMAKEYMIAHGYRATARAEAEAAMELAVEIGGPASAQEGVVTIRAAQVYMELGENERAAEVAVKGCAVVHRAFNGTGQQVVGAEMITAQALRRAGRAEEALVHAEVAVAGLSSRAGADGAAVRMTHAGVLAALKRFDEAEVQALKAYEELMRVAKSTEPRAKEAASAVAALYDAWGKPERAEEWRAKSK